MPIQWDENDDDLKDIAIKDLGPVVWTLAILVACGCVLGLAVFMLAAVWRFL